MLYSFRAFGIFFMLPEAFFMLSPFFQSSVSPSVSPSHFCPEHISKSIEDNLMKLDTLIKGYEGNCKMQEA